MTKDKNLLIFSGSTDPDIGDYKKRYDLVIEEAYHRGYSIVNFILLYSIGAYFYMQKDKPYFHMIWHLFINAAALCHFVGIVFFI